MNMAKDSRKTLATTGEELGDQLLQAVREMNAGLRGRVHSPRVVDAQLTFVKNASGTVTHLILHQGGDVEAKKIK